MLICDEVQSGLGRCGTKLAADHDKIKPDVVVLGKALSGGVFPVSVVLTSDEAYAASGETSRRFNAATSR